MLRAFSRARPTRMKPLIKISDTEVAIIEAQYEGWLRLKVFADLFDVSEPIMDGQKTTTEPPSKTRPELPTLRLDRGPVTLLLILESVEITRGTISGKQLMERRPMMRFTISEAAWPFPAKQRRRTGGTLACSKVPQNHAQPHRCDKHQ
jgi:hypothetical protein